MNAQRGNLGIDSKITQNSWATFTPTVTLAGAGTVPQYTTNSGRYVTIGKTVHADIYLTGNTGNAGSGTTQLRIALPVTAGASCLSGYVSIGHGRDAAFPGTGNFHILGQIAASATYVELALFSAATTTALMTGGDQASTSRTIRLRLTYEID